MADKSSIEWTDATWNPTRGCTKIAPGCKNCYAERFAERFRGVPGHAYEQGFDPRIVPDQLTVPLKWKKPRRIFVNSMSDVFHESFTFEYIDLVFAVMALARQHTFQILTKRPERAVEYFRSFDNSPAAMDRGEAFAEASRALFENTDEWSIALDVITASRFWRGLPNVQIGTSVAQQSDADKNIPHLLQIPAAVRFLSVEPLIESLDIRSALAVRKGRPNSERPYGGDTARIGPPALGWVIVGGESGPGARPCDVAWIRSIVQQCKVAGVPVFVKQLGSRPFVSNPPSSETSADMRWKLNLPRRDKNGEPFPRDRKGGDWLEWPEDLRIREFPAPAEVNHA